jgi:hypothetical protein
MKTILVVYIDYTGCPTTYDTLLIIFVILQIKF